MDGSTVYTEDMNQYCCSFFIIVSKKWDGLEPGYCLVSLNVVVMTYEFGNALNTLKDVKIKCFKQMYFLLIGGKTGGLSDSGIGSQCVIFISGKTLLTSFLFLFFLVL